MLTVHRMIFIPLAVLSLLLVAMSMQVHAQQSNPSIAEIASTGGFTTLVTALDAADLVSTFSDCNAGPFTVFAPAESAFAGLPEGTLDALISDVPTLTDILQYHVVSGTVDAATVVTLDSATTLLGETVAIEATDSGVVLNNVVNVTSVDIAACNGIIHVIDTVLLPPLTKYQIPGEDIFPEGVAYDSAKGVFYVGSTNGGAIYMGSLNSRRMELFSEGGADGRAAATGMKVDDNGILWVSGAATGQMWAYDTADGSLVGTYATSADDSMFINDVAIIDGVRYFTDSFRPVLWDINNMDNDEAETWLEFDGTPITYVDGFNLNGIVATEDGNYLIVVSTAAGKLYRIDTTTQEVVEISVDTEVPGDGMELIGNILYVTSGSIGGILPIEMAADFSSGEAQDIIPVGFTRPTTIAYVDGWFLTVNSQFDQRGANPVVPFTVERVDIPTVDPTAVALSTQVISTTDVALLLLVGTLATATVVAPILRREDEW